MLGHPSEYIISIIALPIDSYEKILLSLWKMEGSQIQYAYTTILRKIALPPVIRQKGMKISNNLVKIVIFCLDDEHLFYLYFSIFLTF